jgi:serine protease Do
MNFSWTITKLLTGGMVSFSVAISAVAFIIQPALTNVSLAQLAQGLAPEEVNLRAKQIAVRIDGANLGSGALIKRSGDVYTVISNWHVMKNTGDYTVQTIDGRKHQVDPASIKQLPGLDLAILQFTSNESYQLVEIGNSDHLNEGQNVYFAGYPGELREEDNRYYRFFTANLVGLLPKSTENGYSIIYNGEAFPGMSGGPVFNKNGMLIGIHGEANINAISGGTSNYGIPINSYKNAIAKLNTQPVAETPKPEENPQPVAETPKPEEDTQPVAETPKPGEISSVPTFTPDVIVTPDNSENPPDNSDDSPDNSESSKDDSNDSSPDNSNSSPNTASENNSSVTAQPVALVSQKTGIDYTSLSNLLEAKKWSEADIQTYKLVEQIIKTAKQENKHVFIELKTIAQFSCSDIRTIDYLWKKYSGNKFGFSLQQEVWQNVNQQGDFSTETWRRFATEVGWKQGEVASGSGYLLYDELDFNPNEAPMGHLPWWFALPEEEQKVMKQLFAQCNFNPSAQELEAEARRDNPKPDQATNTKPNINKVPKFSTEQ